MENLFLSFSIIFPICIMMLLGQFLKLVRFYDDHILKGINNLVFRVFLPTLLFYNIYQTDIKAAFDKIAVLLTVCGILIVFLLLCLIIPFFIKENSKRGVMIQGIFRSNFVIFGLPVVMSIYPDADWGFTSILIAIAVPMFNILSVVVLEFCRGGKVNVIKILKGIAQNPLVLASAFGVLFVLLHIQLPSMVEKTVSDLSKVATPLALVVLGGSIDFKKVKKNIPLLFWGVLSRLVILPMLLLPVCISLGFRQVELATFLTMFASPTAVSSFTMAQQMEGDAELAGELVVFTSVCSVVTMFLWIFTLKQMALL